LLPRGTAATVVTDPTQDRIDKYHRLLAYVVTAGNPVSVNEQLVSEGAARVYVYRRSHPPRRLGKLRAAERQAKAAGRGLWSACPTS
jgi:micrococcal nuclease